MSNGKPLKDDVLQVLQIVVLVGAAAAVFLNVGRRDERLIVVSSQIDELRLVSQDLVKAQVLGSANDQNQMSLLLDLKTRVERLELAGD
tara:strand:- start:1264 stop:1530 length:267 start_codon:yes stop_codon:yes gene_type:complete